MIRDTGILSVWATWTGMWRNGAGMPRPSRITTMRPHFRSTRQVHRRRATVVRLERTAAGVCETAPGSSGPRRGNTGSRIPGKSSSDSGSPGINPRRDCVSRRTESQSNRRKFKVVYIIYKYYLNTIGSHSRGVRRESGIPRRYRRTTSAYRARRASRRLIASATGRRRPRWCSRRRSPRSRRCPRGPWRRPRRAPSISWAPKMPHAARSWD